MTSVTFLWLIRIVHLTNPVYVKTSSNGVRVSSSKSKAISDWWMVEESFAISQSSAAVKSILNHEEQRPFGSLEARKHSQSTDRLNLVRNANKLKNMSAIGTRKKYPASAFEGLKFLKENDGIYKRALWDGAPIVVEEHKLIFFTIPKVGCTVWKQLFRRMAGSDDWRAHDSHLPHNPLKNGLKYLYDYSPDQADRILMDPSWTRAIFVRDPKERFLSAYLDKVISNDGKYVRVHCCPKNQQGSGLNRDVLSLTDTLSPKKAGMHKLLQCPTMSKRDISPSRFGSNSNIGASRSPLMQSQEPWNAPSFQEFVEIVYPVCHDPHWDPQAQRLPNSVWSTINFVGHLDHLETDAAKLLQQIHAWDDFGATGWGRDGKQGIFQGDVQVHHATDSSLHLRKYYTGDLEETVEKLLRQDYDHSVLNLTLRQIVEHTS
jgi:hypothetical protein